jgi:FkbM family methyltransferase
VTNVKLATWLLDRAPAPVATALARSERLKSLLRPLVNRSVSADETVITVRAGGGKGLRMAIDPQLEKYYWTGGHEPHVQAALADHLKKDQSFWDVGAHIGFFALQAARLIGPGGHVVAFEPMPDNLSRLSRNMELNELRNIQIVAEALSDRPGDLPIYSRGGLSVTWTLDPARGSSVERVVPVSTLDERLDQYGEPNLVKIDAEGLECAVLRGGTTLIGRRSACFLVEFMTDALLQEGRQLLDGYSFSGLGDNHWLASPS